MNVAQILSLTFSYIGAMFLALALESGDLSEAIFYFVTTGLLICGAFL